MPVRRILNLMGAAWFCLAGLSAHAAHTQARLFLAAETARPGDTVLAGVQLRMDPRWHTYWRNPGASGMATEIEWQLPAGVTAGAIQWPVAREASGRRPYHLHLHERGGSAGAAQAGGGIAPRTA